MQRPRIDIPKIAKTFQYALPISTLAFGALGLAINPLFFAGSIATGTLTVLDLAFRQQKEHAILRNFGAFGAMRYLLESVGPELRQYIVANDIEERPFNRRQRSLAYRLAKDEKIQSVAFGTLEDLVNKPMIRSSLFPLEESELEPYSLTFEAKNPYTITKPLMISGMAYGTLGANAVSALSLGASLAGIPMNTGEGSLSKYHLSGKCDIIFQIGTGKFGIRDEDGTLNAEKLREIANNPAVKMIELKLQQGAKPGKGGLLPKEKITKEISELRGIPRGQDCATPPRHKECYDAKSTVEFLRQVQEITKLPVGMKLALGNEKDFKKLMREMKTQNTQPAYIAIDGAEGGTGAAPQSFIDNVGIPIFPALKKVKNYRDNYALDFKIIASGKLIDPGSQLLALASGADAIYTARGFLFSLGCIQALQCNTGNCPVGITTNRPELQRGLVIEEKARTVANYANNITHDLYSLLAATGCKNFNDLNLEHIYSE